MNSFQSPSAALADAPELQGQGATPPPSSGAYTTAGVLTADQVIDGQAAMYAHLDPIVVEVTSWVQQALVTENRSEDIERARRDPATRAAIEQEIDRLALQYMLRERRVRGDEGRVVIASVVNDIVGLGPLEPLWQDKAITEVIVNGPADVYVERRGRLLKAKACRFRSQDHLLDVCQRILVPLNRKVDVRDPLADGRLPDGSRVNVVHQALAPRGPLLTIRRFPEENRSLVDLVELGAMSREMALLVSTLVAAKSSMLVVGGTGTGKALDVDTPIPTPSGFVRMGDLAVGDLVFDEHGSPTAVIGAYDTQHDRPCFEVEFSDGTSIIADAEHLWQTTTRVPDTHPTAQSHDEHALALSSVEARILETVAARVPSDAVASTRDLSRLFGWDDSPGNAHGPADRWHPVTALIPAAGTRGPDRLYPAGQLARGALTRWSDHPAAVTAQRAATAVRTTEEIRDTLTVPRTRLLNHSVAAVTHPVAYPEQALPVPPRLLGQQLGRGGTAPDSRMLIPSAYLRSSEAQRRDLLAGLLDTGGTPAATRGATEFRTRSEALARQVLSLAASLGHVPSLLLPDAGTPRGLAHAVVLPASTARPEARHIVDVRPVPSRPVRCIRVASPSHLFLAGEAYVPTHNTTLLNALSAAIPQHERVITIEDSLELRLSPANHVAAMEARPPDSAGRNQVTIRNLVKNSLRMRPDRIIVGEIRDSAALDMLQACNTGHEGSMSTVHANGPDEAISRLAVMVAQGGEIPADKVEWLVGSAIDVIVMVRRYEDGSRRVSGVYEVPDISALQPGQPLRTTPLWEWEQSGVADDGTLLGEYVKRNDVSESLSRAKKLDKATPLTWDALVAMCAPVPPPGQPAAPAVPTPVPVPAVAVPTPVPVPAVAVPTPVPVPVAAPAPEAIRRPRARPIPPSGG